MTTLNRNGMAGTGRGNRPLYRLGRSAMAGMLIGATPGVLLVLLAEFVIDGEMQLTVGAPGLILAVVGAVAGLVVGSLRARPRNGG